MNKLPILFFFIAVSLCSNSFCQANKPKHHYKPEFIFRLKDSLKAVYVRSESEGSSVIELYSDSLFGYHHFEPVDRIATFSSGRYSINTDTILTLKSDRLIFQEVFKRHFRSAPIEKYRFISFDSATMKISNGKYLYFYHSP